MESSDYQKQLVELQLKGAEREREKRRQFETRVLEPVWALGMVAGYVASWLKLFYGRGPSPASIAVALYVLSIIIYLEVWKFPRATCVSEIFQSFVPERRQLKAIECG